MAGATYSKHRKASCNQAERARSPGYGTTFFVLEYLWKSPATAVLNLYQTQPKSSSDDGASNVVFIYVQPSVGRLV